jgi:hypothetical protein
LANRLSPAGVKFLLARAAVHASVRHRLGALLPVLFFTVLLPDDPKSVSTWLAACGFLIIWLMVHWAFELDVDRCAARVMGGGAADALRDVLAVTNPRADWLTTQPPLAWRLRAVQR